MSNRRRININAGAVSETLILSVVARALEMNRPKPLIEDQTALDICDRIDEDIERLASSLTELRRIACIARCIYTERLARDFIKRYPDGTVVNIGCGLDTAYDRVNNGTIQWYDLDLPEVIELRRQFMLETVNRKFIAASFLSDGWLKQIVFRKHIMFIAAGVFYYFEETEIKRFLNKISRMFPSCELVFDVTSPAGVRATNRVLKRVCKQKEPLLRWGLREVDTLLSWNPRFRLLGKYYTYKQEGITMSLKNRILGWISDALDIQYIVHFKIKFDYKHLS